MKYLDLTLPTPAENLALEEALLDDCDEGSGPEVLRFWSPARWMVVVGYANRVATEVNLEVCESEQIPILRRSSGGGTVAQGPGILCYAVILRTDTTPQLAGITTTNRWVLAQVAQTVSELLGEPVRMEGDTDLAIGDRKFAGNAQRRRRRAVLFHGSLLLNADLDHIGKLLRPPSRQPTYRRHRGHTDFLVNLGLNPQSLKDALNAVWKTSGPLATWPQAGTQLWVARRYGDPAWNRKW